MKRLLNSDKLVPLLLLIISFLLTMLGFIGKKQVDSIENIGTQFKQFQIETLRSDSKFDKAIQLNRQWTHDVYEKEIHPNTLRSVKNEKDIIKIKTDVNNIKSIMK